MTISPDTPITAVPRIHGRIIPALRRLGVATVRDLLLYFPSRYEDFSAHKNIADLALGETATITGTVRRVSQGRTQKRHMHLLEAVVEDDTGSIRATWFNQPFLARSISAGAVVRLSGKIAQGPRWVYLQNPAYEKVANGKWQMANGRGTHTGGLIPVYPETEGLTSRWLRFLIKNYLMLAEKMSDPLPVETRERHALLPIADGIRMMHFPETPRDAAEAERRFMFQDLLLWQLRSLRERSRLRQAVSPAIPADVSLIKEFASSLPFALTDAQRRSIWEIARDMEKPRPMHRLLEGDVGSGKTVVAAAASLLAVRAGLRVAFMAPTEILARQHYATLERVLAPFNVTVALRVGGGGKKEHAPPAADITIGTHALIQKGVWLENLGLIIVDEQHRFGVEQRAYLANHIRHIANSKWQMANSEKGSPGHMPYAISHKPHFLSMTATPIPRTLALTIYGDLDLSLLDEMPQSRRPVATRVVSARERAGAYDFIRQEVKKGRQVFVICPRIRADTQTDADSPTSQTYADVTKRPRESALAQRRRQSALWTEDVKAVTEEYKKLSQEIFPDLRVAMLHGKMKPKEKEVIMAGFRDRRHDILVSTSVVEVGVDVPNATVMMIEGAERFGLAQLHQFRGRVGRGAEQSYCFLFATEEGMGERRLHAVAEARNGFELAEKDLALRGPGSMLGTEQSGIGDRVLKGITDPVLVRAVREEAVALVKKSPDLSAFPILQKELQRMEAALHME